MQANRILHRTVVTMYYELLCTGQMASDIIK